MVHQLEVKEILGLHWFRPTPVKILMVTDGGGSFDTGAGFGLGRVIDAMRSDPWWWTRFDITTAHRSTGAAYGNPAVPHHNNFRFVGTGFPAGMNLQQFDQIWLFGVLRTGIAPVLSAAERDALLTFMNGGGGIFATGDHDDLGASLCSEIPRVRYMRKWTPGGVAGTPPPVSGPTRHDTLREGPTAGYQFNDQSDAVPQVISPRMYFAGWYPVSPWFRRRRPHPVLCGRTGILNVLPDHMHEGEIVVPSSVAGNAEWPMGVAPEVIADATILPHSTDGDPVNGKKFGVLGAYDGHRASVGRIVVDATWHHWFNINLVGFPVASAEYEKIRNYYWNVGLWLARPATIQSMFNKAIYGFPWTVVFKELDAKMPLHVLGSYGIDAIGRRASQCAVSQFLIWRYPRPLRELVWEIEDKFPVPPNPPDPPPFREIYLHEEFAMGGMLQAMMASFPGHTPPKEMPDERKLAALVDEGLSAGLKEWTRFTREGSRYTEKILHRLQELGLHEREMAGV
jgi:hypothetical protein